ncbi:MAG: conserved membrane protein of unknown function [Candidatus Thorarchaeota archaeon]|nr:MAG: conserved membrane protein of unknown function [Candidatus Thorarchaeota archaeon]
MISAYPYIVTTQTLLEVRPTMNETINESTDDSEQCISTIFDKYHFKYYLFVMGLFAIIIGTYYLLSGIVFPIGGGIQQNPPDGIHPTPLNPPPGTSSPGQQEPGLSHNLWPLWGQLTIPSPLEIVVFLGVVGSFLAIMYYFHNSERRIPPLPVITLFGFMLIVSTNFIHGWLTGIYSSIGGMGEILTDAMLIENPIYFIRNYVSNQGSLTTHAQTQPPFAVLTIYLFCIFFQDPGVIAITLAAVTSIFSSLFLYGVYRRYFDTKTSEYAVLLFLVLPAVQIYYLANIYAFVALWATALLYFYLHEKIIIRIIGSTLAFFFGSFTSFLFVYMALFLFLFEIIRYWKSREDADIIRHFVSFSKNISCLIVIGILVGIIYLTLWIYLDFNYLDSFLHATNAENPNGFMLFDNPLNYFVTRIQNVMDILVFYGPILTALSLFGYQLLKQNQDNELSAELLSLLLASVFAILLLFMTGAPKKGETARICMFILPVVLMPVIYYLKEKKICRRDWIILLMLVFVQAAIMQLIGIWVW